MFEDINLGPVFIVLKKSEYENTIREALNEGIVSITSFKKSSLIDSYKAQTGKKRVFCGIWTITYNKNYLA